MMRPQYWGVPGEVVKVVHDDSDEQVEHEEAAEEDEGDKPVGRLDYKALGQPLGHVDLILKSDGAHALVEVVQELK